MENASKALLMAAGMLIAMLAASMFALLFSTMSDYSRQYEETRQAQDIQKFNAQFMQYMKDEGSTAQDVVSVYNLAEYYREKEGIEVKVLIGATQLPVQTNKPFPGPTTSDEFIDDNTNITQSFAAGQTQYQINNFTANITYNDGKISEIKFIQNGTRTLHEI